MGEKSLSIVGIIFILLILAVPFYFNIVHKKVSTEKENSQYYDSSYYTDDYNW